MQTQAPERTIAAMGKTTDDRAVVYTTSKTGARQEETWVRDGRRLEARPRGRGRRRCARRLADTADALAGGKQRALDERGERRACTLAIDRGRDEVDGEAVRALHRAAVEHVRERLGIGHARARA